MGSPCLEDESKRTSVEDVTSKLLAVGHGQNYDFLRRIVLQDLTCRFQPVYASYVDIEQDDVRLKLADFFDGFNSVAGFAADFPFRTECKKRDEHATNHFLAVGNKNAK